MSEATLSAGLAAVGALAGAGVTLLLGRRNTSGSVLTSTAQQLWDESTAFRQVQADRIVSLVAQVDHLHAEIERLYQQIEGGAR